jgi:hypothetical protein
VHDPKRPAGTSRRGPAEMTGSLRHRAGDGRYRVIVPVVVVLLAGACHVTPKPATVPGLRNVSIFVRDARLTRAVVFDRGALKLNPASRPVQMSEQHALDLWQSTYVGSQEITVGAVVFLARVTLGIPVSRAKDLQYPPMHFHRRLSWVFMWGRGPSNCPAQVTTPGPRESTSAKPRSTPIPSPSVPLEIIASDESGEGVYYGTRGGSTCFPEQVSGPSARPAFYAMSVSWKLVKRSGTDVLLRATTIPACATVTGASSSSGAGSGPSLVISVTAEVLMVGAPCIRKGQEQELEETVPDGEGPIARGKTGLPQSRVTDFSSNRLDYFDGSRHSVRTE